MGKVPYSTRQVYPTTEFAHQRFRGQEAPKEGGRGTWCLYCRILLKIQLKRCWDVSQLLPPSICWQPVILGNWFTVQNLTWTVIRYPCMEVNFGDSCFLLHCVAFHFSELCCWLNIFFYFITVFSKLSLTLTLNGADMNSFINVFCKFTGCWTLLCPCRKWGKTGLHTQVFT